MIRSGIKICCWILYCYVGMTGLLSQSLISEQVRIHTDRKLYASGKTIWLKLYVTDALTFRPTSLSAIAYVELWDVQGDIIFQTKVSLEKGLGTATIDIPPNQETGEYLIRAYTRWMANSSPDNFAHQAIVIFDPDQSIPIRDTSQLPLGFRNTWQSSPSRNSSAKHQETLQIDLSLNKTHIESREQVQVEIRTKDSQGIPISANLSLSIAKVFPIEQVILSPYFHTNFPDTVQNTETNQLPDLYGLNLSGSVFNELGQGVGEARVFFCLPGKTPIVQYAESTSEGWFRFLLPELYGNKEILIAARDSSGKELQLRLDTDILGGRPRLPAWSLTFPPGVVEELQQYALQHQIQKTYQAARPVPDVKQEVSLSPFYQTVDHVYKLDEYTRFSMEETFLEIIYSVTLRKQQGRPYARVYNDNRKQLMDGDPLILIDGIPVPDISYVLALQSKEVERIEVLTSPYYIYGQVYDGIIHVVSFLGDASKVVIPDGAIRKPYAFLAPKRTFQLWQAESVFPPYSERIPDMRRLLIWKPMIQTDEQGKAKISFWTSDITGMFEVQVQGLANDGSWGTKRIELSVDKKAP